MIKEYDKGIISFKDYLEEIEVNNLYKDKYSWVKSIIIYIIPYYNVTYSGNYLPAKFAYLEDYHTSIQNFLKEEAKKIGLGKYETLVDVSFLNEKVCASLAGLGSVGKNQLFISKRFGTFCNIGTIVTDKEYECIKHDRFNLCLNCDKCIKACPTKALDNGFNKYQCLSYLSQSASTNFELFDNMVLYYGCDKCQDACPFNKGDRDHIYDSEALLNLEKFENIKDYKEYSKNKTYNWIGYLKMLRNLLVLEVNNRNISVSKLEYYQEKYKDTEWFYNHLEYLKKKIGE